MKIVKIRDERGIVSIMISMIMIIVISLIVIGFSQVARRNQRESLDRQLSTQAYYAAESGVNVADNYLQTPANAASPVDTLSTGNCTGVASLTPAITLPVLQSDASGTAIGTTCLMLNTQPTTLVATPVTQASPVVFHVQDGNAVNFTNLVFTWSPPDNLAAGSYNCNASHAASATTAILPAYGSWDCSAGILRVDFVPVPATGIAESTLNDAEDNTKTVYFTPNSTVANQSGVNLGSTDNAYVRQTKCATYTTTGGITTCATTGCGTSAGSTCAGIVTAGLSGNYYIRVSTLYKDAGNVTIAATDSVTSQVGGVKFIKGQAVVDSTGKAQDQYRRVQVRIPLVSTQTALPLFGLQSTNTICKQLSAAPGIYTSTVCPGS